MVEKAENENRGMLQRAIKRALSEAEKLLREAELSSDRRHRRQARAEASVAASRARCLTVSLNALEERGSDD
jgi:hypothetical protein